MPEGYTHIRIAQRAAAAVRYKVKCPAAFAAGANGPDTFFCYQAWKPARGRLYDLPALGRRLHHEKTGPFLRSLVSHVRTVPQIEYAMGFLSHYAADTVIHPYVEALCRPGMPYAKKGGHGYFEAALDTLLHEQDTGSKGAVPAADCAPVLAGEALADIANLLHTCLREVYDLDVPVEYLADSFHHSTVLRGLFTSRWGVRRTFYWLVEPFFAGRGYITGHVTPRKMKKDLPDAWTDPFSGQEHSEDIFALLEQAQSRSEKYMAATILAWGGQLSSQALAEQLGSMSYLEGRATALSDPNLAPPEPEKTEPPAPAEAEPASGPESAEAPEDAEAPEAAAEPAEAAETARENSAESGETDGPAAVAGPTDEGGAEPAPPAAAPEPPAQTQTEGENAAPAETDPEPPLVTVLALPPELSAPVSAGAEAEKAASDPAEEAEAAALPAEDDPPDTEAPAVSVSERLRQMLLEDPPETDIPSEQAPEAIALPGPDQDAPQEGETL